MGSVDPGRGNGCSVPHKPVCLRGRERWHKGILNPLSLFYDVVAGHAERRQAFRAAHLAHARRAVERGELVLGGALANPLDRAVLLFRGSSPAVAEAFAAGDPYVTNGPVTRWHVREWTTVVGVEAAVPPPETPA